MGLHSSTAGTWVPSLVIEIRSHKLRDMAKKKKKKKKKSRYLSRTSNLSRTKNPDLPFFEGSYSLELYNLSLFTNT